MDESVENRSTDQRSTDQIRADLEEKRQDIARTVDQIDNRANPSRIAERQAYRVKQKLTDVRDSIMGNDNPDYVDQHERRLRVNAARRGSTSGGTYSDMSPGEMASTVRRRTSGNPIAAGVVAAGLGALAGSVLSQTSQERKAARRFESEIGEAASTVRESASSAAGDMKESALRSADTLKSEAKMAASDMADETKAAVNDVRS